MKRSAAGGLAGRRLLVVTGKGGVGKSTVGAALAQVLAAAGRRVILLELDPREPLHTLFGVPPSAGEFTAAAERITLLSLRPRAVIAELVRDKVRVAAIARRVTAHPVFAHFVDGAPGLKEMAALGYALRLVRGERGPGADVVVLDAPATGLVSQAIPARCAAVVVTLAEEMPVQEAIELVAMLEARVGRGPELVIANGLYPTFPPSPTAPFDSPGTTGVGSGVWTAALHLWRQRRDLNERELARLTAAWSGPRAELPLLPLPPGPELVTDLAGRLAPLIGPS